MKTTSLFQLGGIAILLSAILTGLGNLIYLLSGQPDQPITLDIWRGIFSGAFFVLGFGALFVRQSQRSGILGLIGYIFIMLAQMYFFGSDAVNLAAAAGAISREQILRVPSYALVDTVLPWIWASGLLFFGISIFRAKVASQYSGVLLVLVGLIQPLTGPLAFTRPIYAIFYFVAWAWLGWDLYSKARLQGNEQPGIQQTLTANPSR